jgi:hypothetical protein
MPYETFIQHVTSLLHEKLGSNFSVTLNKVTKNNGVEFDTLSIHHKSSNQSPLFYLDDYYSKYCNGTSLNELVNTIIDEFYSKKSYKTFNVSQLSNFNSIKSSIICKVINADMNASRLKDLPHYDFLDLSITFQYIIDISSNNIGTITVTNEMLSEWKISLKELYDIALQNTNCLLPVSIDSMSNIILRMLLAEENTDRSLSTDDSNLLRNDMYVVTNTLGVNGATSIIYPNIFREFCTQNNISSIYILPSSIHELIILPNIQSIDEKSLSNMVKEVNTSQVMPDEVLSNNIYLYSTKSNEISLLS